MRNHPLYSQIITLFGTVSVFAETLPMHQSHVSLILHGKRLLTQARAERWLELLGEQARPLIEEVTGE